MENNSPVSVDRPTVMITNDDGIDAPGLRALVRVLVSSNRFHVLVCAPDSYVCLLDISIIYSHKPTLSVCVIFSVLRVNAKTSLARGTTDATNSYGAFVTSDFQF